MVVEKMVSKQKLMHVVAEENPLDVFGKGEIKLGVDNLCDFVLDCKY